MPRKPPSFAVDDDEAPMRSDSRGERSTFINESDLAALTTAAERLQASFRDTMDALPPAKALPVLEDAAIPDMVLTLPPRRTEIGAATPPRPSGNVALPPVYSPLETASEPPPVKEAPLMVAKLERRATRAAEREAEEATAAQAAQPPATEAAAPNASTSDVPGASAATGGPSTNAAPKAPRRRNLAQKALGGLGRAWSLLPLPGRAPDEDIVDDEFLKDMQAPEAANATIMIQALFRRNKFLANKFLKSQRPEPPAVPRHYFIHARTPVDQQASGVSVFDPLPPRTWVEVKVKLIDLPIDNNLYWTDVYRQVSGTLYQTLGSTDRYCPERDGTIEFRERFQLEVAEEFQQMLKIVVYRKVMSMHFQKCRLNIPLLFLIGLPNQTGIFPMLTEADKRKGNEPQNWVEISISDLSAPRLALQLPLEVSALPMPWFSDRTHFMVISRKAQNKDLKRRESAMAELALNVVGEAASLLLHTGMSGATVALGGFNALKSVAKAAGKGDALSAFKSISNEVQKNASYVDQAAKFLFGYRRDTNWEPILCSRRVEDTNSPRFKEVSLPLNPFIDDSAPPTQGDFDCPVKIEIFRTKPEVETSDSKEDAPFFLAASAECKLIDLMQPDFSLELRAPRMAMFKAEGGVLRSYAPPKVRRVCQFPLLLKAGVKLRLIFGVDFSADSFKEPLVHAAKLGGESMAARAFHRTFDALYPTLNPGDYYHCLGFASLLFGEGDSVFGLSSGGESICTTALNFLYGYNAAMLYCLPDKDKSYTEIMRKAAFSEDAPNYYKVLVILTADGDFDMQETVDAIVAIAKQPITVFIQSLHDEPDSYEKHRLLDRRWLSPLVSSTGEVACRNMVHFISNATDFTDVAASERSTVEMMELLKKDIELYYSELDTSFFEPEDITAEVLSSSESYCVLHNENQKNRLLSSMRDLSELTQSDLSIQGRRNALQRTRHPEAIFVDEEPAELIVVDKHVPDEVQQGPGEERFVVGS